MPRWLPTLLLPVALAAGVPAVPPAEQQGKPQPADADAHAAAARAQVEGGLKARLWAAEPLLKNPVAFSFDGAGACYVAETERLHDGVPDTRGFMHWLDDDIASRSVADRLALYQKHKYPAFEKYGERLRKVWDAAGVGRATDAKVVAGPFDRPADGIIAGVLAHGPDVYIACIPSLYKIPGAGTVVGPNDGKPRVLSTGYGVRNQFIGHDLHGLVMGPDGRVYFSIGDRGLNVSPAVVNLDSGAVLRCDPDGGNLEVVHTGLRNPQELAFDDFGNLFTFDNNSDSGDKARWVQVVEGGDSGWRCGYQYGTLMHHAGVPQGNRGPWNTEKIWHVPGPDGSPPAYVVPPLAHFGNGPSGLCAYPGVGLSDRYKGHFFACDFTASATNSHIWSLAVKPKGASFEVTDLHKFVSNMVPTDCEFGPDGAFYWLDWTGGWNKPEKGRIFRVTDPEAMKNPAVAEAKKLLAATVDNYSDGRINRLPIPAAVKLLGHPDRRVRLTAQSEICLQHAPTPLLKVLAESSDRVARLHALWGLNTWVNGRRFSPPSGDPLASLAADSDPAIRANVARMLGRLGQERATDLPVLATLLTDPDPAVRAAAAPAYGRTAAPPAKSPGNGRRRVEAGERQGPPSLVPLFELLRTNADADAYLRQAGVEGLARASGEPADLVAAWKQSKLDTPAVRLGVVLALRKLRGPQLADFLADTEPDIVAEAARAIYDQGLDAAMPALAKLADATTPEPVAYRALAANFRLGGAANAARVAAFAARSSELPHLREAALKLLADWTAPKRLDPITGLRQDLPERPATEASAALTAVLPKLFAGPDIVRKAAVQVTSKLGVAEVGPLLAGLVGDDKLADATRAEALTALQELKAKELPAAVEAALKSSAPRLKAAGRVSKVLADPVALAALAVDGTNTVAERQLALRALGEPKTSKPADEALATLLDGYDKLPAELRLDVMEAAQARTSTDGLAIQAPLREKLKTLDQAARAAEAKDNLARYRESLAGGDADKGREHFLNNAAVYCQRCHQVNGQGGEVGPKLDGIGTKHPRDYLLEALVHPNAKIAEGYQSVILSLADGRTVSGVLRAKTDKAYTLVTADNKVLTVPTDDVDAEKPDQSAMPADLIKKLSKRELRDIVEYLVSLKEGGK